MFRPLTKAEAQAFRDRWRRVNAREEEELRSMSMELKVQQLNTLMNWAQHLGPSANRDIGVAEVRQRWARLRKAHGG